MSTSAETPPSVSEQQRLSHVRRSPLIKRAGLEATDAGTTGINRPVQLGSRRTRAAALVLAGVLVFSDIAALAWAGLIGTIATLFMIGFLERRLRAVAWALSLVASAFIADLLWQLDWGPFNRSDDYEPIPQTPYVLIALPIPMAVVALGVGASTLWRSIRSEPDAT